MYSNRESVFQEKWNTDMRRLWGSTMLNYGTVLLDEAVTQLKIEQECISALRLVGENQDPSFLSLRRKILLYQVMLICIQKLKSFQAICSCCNKFSLIKMREKPCPFLNDECPIHMIYRCDVCHNQWDMTTAPEDIDYLILHTRHRFFNKGMIGIK